MIHFMFYRSNYDICVDGEFLSLDADFTVGDGDGYDFTAAECVDSDIDTIIERFPDLDDEALAYIRDNLESYYANHDN